MLHDAWLANPERHTGVTWVLCSRHNHCCVPTLNNNVRRQTMREMTDSELAHIGGVIALLALMALGTYIMFSG